MVSRPSSAAGGPGRASTAADLAHRLARAGYAACACALVFSATQLYGGTDQTVEWLTTWLLHR